MTEIEKQKSRERARRWRKNNPAWSSSNSRKWAIANPKRVRASQLRSYLKNKSKAWIRKLKYRYNITAFQYEAMLKKQHKRCAVCGKTNSNGKRLFVDHNHKCCSGERSCGKCVRGLLCNRCNHATGLLRESLELVRKLGRYIKRYERINSQ